MKKIISAFVLFCCITGAIYSEEPAYTVITDKATTPILNPSFSKRQTLKIRLKNGLQAYLISDPNIEQSAAALTVNVGSWQDPVEAAGMAHFTEHMLFLGTSRFPKESEFSQYVTDHGGSTNAFTEDLSTTFLFSINDNAFAEAMDRFSSFFKEPLFNPSGVRREMNAVDQEFSKNLINDTWREIQVLKELSNPEHPDHLFSIGNRETLSHISQDALKKWYHEHYSANLMHVVVYSSLPIEQLKDLVIKDFSGILNKNKSVYQTTALIRSPESAGQIIYIDPVKNSRAIALTWEMPQHLAEQNLSKPENLVCFVLGDEGEGSLIAQLRKEDLAETLSCGDFRVGKSSLTFYLEIELTQKGLKNYETVVERFYQTIANFKNKGLPKYLYDELKKIEIMKYQYPSRMAAFPTVMYYSRLLINEPLETFPEETQIVQKYDPQIVKEFVEFLTPQNSQILLLAKAEGTGVEFDRKEKWMQVPYAVKKIPSKTLQAWADAKPNPNIDLPLPNPFITANLGLLNPADVIAPDENYSPKPKAIIDSDEAKIYFAPDTYYLVPEIYWSFEVKTPSVKPDDALSVVLTDLYVKAITDLLNSMSYPANVAGLKYAIYRLKSNMGIGIALQGYSDKGMTLFQEILKKLKNINPTEEQFKIYKETLLREYQNFYKEKPLDQAQEILESIVYQDFITEKEKAKAIKKTTRDQLLQFQKGLFNKTYTEGVLFGNMTEAQGAEAWQQLKQTMASASPYLKEERPLQKLILLPDRGPNYIEKSSKAEGNAVILAIEYVPFSFKTRAMQQILMQSIDPHFYTNLRTQQQTGYLVFSTAEEWEKHLFSIFGVQSTSHDARDLLARFELSIDSFLQELADLTPEQFDSMKQTLIINTQKPPASLAFMGELLKVLAFKYDGDFDWKKKRVQGFKDLTLDEYVTMVHDYLGHKNKRRLAILFEGVMNQTDTLQYKRIRCLEDLRNRSTYFSRFEASSNK